MRWLAFSRVAYAIAISLTLGREAAAQTWFEFYHQAQEALAEERWSEAVRHLNAAVERKPSSSARARTYGMRFIAYFPYHDLGVAYHELGQADAALQAFETEERQGEIQRSNEHHSRLVSRRDAILEEKARADDAKLERARDVVEENLRSAAALEEQARFGDALDAVARVLAVSPDLEEAQAARRRLLAAIADDERRRDEDERVASLVRRGRERMASGDYRAATVSLTRALEIRRDADTSALLERAQAALRSSEPARPSVADQLDRALALERAGELDDSLGELQAILAADPTNAEALRSQQRILAAEAANDRLAQLRTLLSRVEAELETREYQQALRTANRILTIDPAHEDALRHLGRAYAGLSDALLASDNAPPSILLDDRREETAGGRKRELIREAPFVLTGTVYDDTPVELAIRRGGADVGSTTVRSREILGVWATEFTFRHEMEGGLSTLELTATDQGGKTAAETYAVEYRVPFSRSRWFAAVVGATVVGSGVLFAGARMRRRRSLLRNRFNPYIAGAPILEQARFFGRDQLLDYVLRRIHNNSILLYGERRIGKTSFQHRLKRSLAELQDPEHVFYPVFIDLQGTPEDKFFATLALEIFDELEPLLDGIEPNPALHGGDYGYRELVKDLRAVVKALRRRSEKRAKLVLLIDEVDELNDYDPRVNQRLRSLFMRTFADSLVAVVSGVAIKKHWEREGSPWYNFFQEVEVQPLDKREAAALIEGPVKGVFTFTDGVVDEILRRTSCKPYLIQRICGALVDRGHTERQRSFTLSDLDIVCEPEGL